LKKDQGGRCCGREPARKKHLSGKAQANLPLEGAALKKGWQEDFYVLLWDLKRKKNPLGAGRGDARGEGDLVKNPHVKKTKKEGT